MLKKVKVIDLEWQHSPTMSPGCFGKKLFVYGDSGRLGSTGVSNSYTTMYRLDPGAAYPEWTIQEGSVEIGVLRGVLLVNGENLNCDEWVQLSGQDQAVSLTSELGCEVLAIVRGTIRLAKHSEVQYGE